MTTIDPRSSPLPACKPSGWKWLKALPKHWEARKLKHCLGVNESTLPETTDPDLEFRYIEIGAVNSGDLVEPPAIIRFSAAPSRARRIVKGGDTIVSTVRTYLKAVWYAEDPGDNLICSTGFAVLTPKQGTVPKFASYVAQSAPFTDQVTAESVGIAYPAIGEKKLGDLRIGLPPTDEQAAIVRFLDHADEQIKSYIAGKERLIALLEEERQALVHQAVTRGLDPSVRLKDSGVEWLGGIPDGWDLVRIKSVARVRYGLGQPPPEKDGGLPLIRATNVSRGHILEHDMVYVDPQEVPQNREAFLSEGEIIVVRSGAYTADSAIIPPQYNGAVTGYDMVLKPTEILPEFLGMALLTNYLRDDQLIINSTRAAQPHLNAEELGNALIILPPKEEQINIAMYLDDLTASIDTAVAQARSPNRPHERVPDPAHRRRESPGK